MPFGGALTAAAAPILGGVIGNIAGAGDRRSARDQVSEAMGMLANMGMPPELAREIVYKKLEQQGQLTPELEQIIQQEASKVAEIQADPESIRAQKQALEMLGQRSQVGMTPEERANLAVVQQQAARDAESKRQQILQNMQQRGQAGGGQELAAALGASQAAASTANLGGIQAASAADQARMAALGKYAGLAGDIRSGSFGEEQVRGSAADALQRFNIENQRGVQQRNIGSKNVAQQFNLQEAQRIADANTQMQNQAKQQAREWARQDALAKMGATQAAAGMKMGAANMANQQAQQRAQMWSGIGQGVGAGASGIGQYNQNQQFMNLLSSNKKPSSQESFNLSDSGYDANDSSYRTS